MSDEKKSAAEKVIDKAELRARERFLACAIDLVRVWAARQAVRGSPPSTNADVQKALFATLTGEGVHES